MINTNEYPHKVTIGIDGMACEHCAHRVEKAFQALDMVAQVDLDEKRAVVYMKERPSDEAVLHIVQKLGFEACIIG